MLKYNGLKYFLNFLVVINQALIMIRITLLTLLISYLSVYAWKDWFRGACWLVLLISVFQHPDMPKSIAGISGFNHWNFLFINVFMSWLCGRKKDNISWDMPSKINILLCLYFIFIFISVLRYFADIEGISLYLSGDSGGMYTVNEYLINCVKWVIPSMIIFDGCRSRQQYNFALMTLMLMFFLLALQVIQAMKFGSLTMSGEALQRKALKVISNNIGFHRVNMSMMMSGAFWAIFCLKEYVSSKTYLFLIIPACFAILLAIAMTGGRVGYVTWLVLGAIICSMKWRKYLLFAPIVLFSIMLAAPSALERISQGILKNNSGVIKTFTDIDFAGGQVDTHSMTSGRTLVWPLVWESILDEPLIGHGRRSMIRLGITRQIIERHGAGEVFPHPHNAYLQWVQDNGFVGAVPVFLFYFIVLKYSWSLFREKVENIYIVTGGVCFSFVAAFLLASIGSQTFYPREGAVGMWVAITLMLRVYVERDRVNSNDKSELICPSEAVHHRFFVKM